ncbi:hypothetical protein BH10PLA2_BH10PLA2_13080 [soil metagenome]
MKKVLRQTIAIVTGMILAILLVSGVEVVSNMKHPPPPGSNGTFEEMCELVRTYPQWLLGAGGIAWCVTAFLSTGLATLIGGRIPGIIVAVVLLAALGFNLSMLPYVTWFKIVMPIGLMVGCFLGVKLGRLRVHPLGARS